MQILTAECLSSLISVIENLAARHIYQYNTYTSACIYMYQITCSACCMRDKATIEGCHRGCAVLVTTS